MPTVLWEVDFSAGTTAEKAAKAAKFYQTPDLLDGVPARLSIMDAPDGVTGLLCGWGKPAPGTISYATFALMDATSPANGATANAYDPDPALHGYYLRTGGAWVRQGRVLDKPWFDPNHEWPGGQSLALWVQSWATNDDDTGGQDPAMPPGFNGWPYSTDLRGLELHARMRAIGLKMPRSHKLVQHFQTVSTTSPPMPTVSGQAQVPYVNAAQITDVHSDTLKFGRAGFWANNAVEGVYDSGWRDHVTAFSPLDSDWKQFGARNGRSGLGPGPATYYNYVVEEPDAFLQNPSGIPYNAYMVSTQPTPGTTFPTAFDDDDFSGYLLIEKFQLVDPA